MMNTRNLIQTAPRRLSDARDNKKIVLYYAGLLTGLSALSMGLTFLLNMQIGKSGGLSSMGTRSILSALQSMLPIIQSVLVMCLALGYRSTMLRISRGQHVSPRGLRLGFDRLWVLLRCGILQAALYIGIGMASMYLASIIFTMTPWADSLAEIAAPMISGLNSTLTTPVLDEAALAQLMPAMQPMLWIFLAVFLIFAIPVALRLRMADYVIIDKPALGAMAALRESRRMMRGNVMDLVKLDLRLWWYYAALALATVLCYGDTLLAAFGVKLPVSPTVAYYGFYLLYLIVQFGVYYWLGNRVEVTYALAYEEIRPREEENAGVVLGNIFQGNSD